jgi:hypothetical protein
VRIDRLPTGAYRLRWPAETGALGYNVYRATLTGPGAGDFGACYRQSVAATYTLVDGFSLPGAGHTYLVTAELPGGEGTLGTDSAGIKRTNTQPCP